MIRAALSSSRRWVPVLIGGAVITACSATPTVAATNSTQPPLVTSTRSPAQPTTPVATPPATTAGAGPTVGAGPTAATTTASTSSPAAGPAVTEANPVGDIPDTQAFVDYTSATGGWAVQVPEGWARTESATSVAFTDKYNSIIIDTTAVGTAPSAASAQTEMAGIGTTSSGFSAGQVTTVSRAAGDAILLTFRADSPVNAVTGKVVSQDVERYEFWRSGTQVSINLAGPTGSDNVDPWRTVTDSFRWIA